MITDQKLIAQKINLLNKQVLIFFNIDFTIFYLFLFITQMFVLLSFFSKILAAKMPYELSTIESIEIKDKIDIYTGRSFIVQVEENLQKLQRDFVRLMRCQVKTGQEYKEAVFVFINNVCNLMKVLQTAISFLENHKDTFSYDSLTSYMINISLCLHKDSLNDLEKIKFIK